MRWFRLGALATFFAGILAFFQGCTEGDKLLFLFWLLVLSLFGADDLELQTNSVSSISLISIPDPNLIVLDQIIGHNVVKNQLLVAFNTTNSNVITNTISSWGGIVRGWDSRIDLYQIEFSGFDLQQLKSFHATVRSNSNVEFSSLFFTSVGDFFTPDDPFRTTSGSESWTENSPAGNNWGQELVKMPSAWAFAIGNHGIRIGIVDSGFEEEHEDLKNNFKAKGFNPLDTGSNINHGTFVTGIAAAEGDNGRGVAGICFGCSLTLSNWSRKDPNPNQPEMRAYFEIAGAIFGAIKNKSRAINISAGMWYKSGKPPNVIDTCNTPFNEKIEAAKSQAEMISRVLDTLVVGSTDPLLVFAAGNCRNVNPQFNMTAAVASQLKLLNNNYDDRVIIVTSVDIDKQLSSFANKDDTGTYIDVAAPGGVGIISTLPGYWKNNYGRTGIEIPGGTSFAAPFVTGLAGLIWAKNPSLTAKKVKDIIIEGSINGGLPVALCPVPCALQPYYIMNAFESLKLADASLAILQVQPASVVFSAQQGINPASQNVNISNTGTGSLNWSISDNQPWLQVNPTSGSGNATITVSINTSGLSVGQHSGSITVTATGVQNSPQTVGVSLNITSAPNQAPTCNNITISTTQNIFVDIDLAQHCSDPDVGDILTGSFVSDPPNGIVQFLSPAIRYTPDNNFTGQDSFTFRVKDNNNAESNTATVTVTVNAPQANQAPVCGGLATGTPQNQPIDISITPTCSDPDGNSITIAFVGNAANGTVQQLDPTTVRFTPSSSNLGSFQIRVTDGSLESNTATWAVNISAPSGPSATIASPLGGTFLLGSQTTFIGGGQDSNNNLLPGTALSWSSSIQGSLGTGSNFNARFLKPGTHTITLTVTDGAQTATDTTSVIVSDIYDDFNDGSLDATKWSQTLATGSSSSESNNKLNLTLTPSLGVDFEINTLSSCQLQGDFDIEVSYALTSWISSPNFSGVRVGLGLRAVGSSTSNGRVSVERASYTSNDPDPNLRSKEAYVAAQNINNSVATVFGGPIETSATSGGLRLTRTGSTITGYFRSGAGSFTQINSASISSANMYFRVAMWSGSGIFDPQGQNISATIDNMKINSGIMSCP